MTAGIGETAVVVGAGATVTVNGELVDGLKLESPEYAAVIECAPPDREDVLKLAVLPVRLTVASTVAPSLKITLPVGVWLEGELIVAVKVSLLP